MNIKNQMLGRLTIGEQPKLKLFAIFNITTAYQNSKIKCHAYKATFDAARLRVT